jgi:hypothetical protein
LIEKEGRKAVLVAGDIRDPGQTASDEAIRPARRIGDAHVMLADPLSSYTSGTTVAVTGGKPFM